MKKNVGSLERIIRIIVGVLALVLFFINYFSGILHWVALVVGIMMLFVAFTQSCPLYSIFGISSCKVKK